MEPRYWLRFDSGDRRGSRVPVPASGLTVGRNPACDLVVPDSSVSGRHAGLEVLPEGVLLRDLGSRNGTRVGGERVDERLLAHSDSIRLGQVALTFLDDTLVGTTDAAPEGTEASDGVHHLDARAVAGGRPRGLLLAAAGVAVVVASAWLAWDALRPRGTAAGPARTAVTVDGNLVADASFEGDTPLAGWETSASGLFAVDRAARNAGLQGVGATLTGGESARLASPFARVRLGQALTASAALRVEGDVRAVLGIELGSSTGGAAPLAVWGETPGGVPPGDRAAVSAHVLPGFDRARLVLDARSGTASGEPDPFDTTEEETGGAVAIDDVVLVPDPARAPSKLAFDEYELHLFGDPARSCALVRIDTVLLASLAFLSADGTASARPGEPDGGRTVGLDARALANGIELVPSGAARLTAVVREPLAGMRIATLSDNGPRLHGGDFEAEGVNGVLLGESPLLVRIGFDRPTDVRATPVPAGSDGDGASGGGEVGLVIGPVRGPVVLQLSFREERNGAADLADAARQAERADRPAECLAHWAELLRRFPFDAALVAEATAERARHVQEGLDRVEEIRAAFERARFFDLEGIYRRERTNVAAVEERYAGSEVAEEAARLRAEIDTALASHVDADREARRERLARVAAILEERGADDLARHVRESAPDASAADRPSEGGD